MLFTLSDFSSWFGVVSPQTDYCHFRILAMTAYAEFCLDGYVHDKEFVVVDMTSYCARDELYANLDDYINSRSEIIRFGIDENLDIFQDFQVYVDDIRSKK